MLTSEADLSTLRRELLSAALADTEGTIRATDTKASIALVLHGLLFTGLLGVTRDIGPLYADHGTLLQVAVVVSVGTIGLTFLSSVLQLLRCVAPAPEGVVPDLTPARTGVFFVMDRRAGQRRWVMPSVSDLHHKLHGLDEAAIESEWLAEVVAVSAIRQRKLRLVTAGYRLLALELVATVVYLAILGVVAA